MFSENVHRPVADPLASRHPFSTIPQVVSVLVSIVQYDTFLFALPSIESTTVLLPPRVTNSIPATVLGGTNNKGSNSLSFLRRMPPFVILICHGVKWIANTSAGTASVFLGGCFLHFCIYSPPPPILPIRPEAQQFLCVWRRMTDDVRVFLKRYWLPSSRR